MRQGIIFLLFFFIVYPLKILGQDISEKMPGVKVLYPERFYWSSWESKLDSNLMNNLLGFAYRDSVVRYYEGLYSSGSFSNFCNAHKDSFHFIDLDNDGDQDLIFDGKDAPGYESGTVNIYLNKGRSLELNRLLLGTIIKMERDSNGCVGFTIFDYPCCADYGFFMTDYFYDKSDSLVYLSKNMRAIVGIGVFSGDRILPQSIPLNESFKIKSDSLCLRWSADESGKLYPWDIPQGELTNLIGTYPSGSTGTILSAEKDKFGHMWYFVLMDNNISPLNDILSWRYSKWKPGYKTYGWLKATNSIEVTSINSRNTVE